MKMFKFEKHHFVNTSARPTNLDDCVKLANEQLELHINPIIKKAVENLEALTFFGEEYQRDKDAYSVSRGYWVDEKKRRIEASKEFLTSLQGGK